MLINNACSLEWMCRKQLVLYNQTKAAITTDARLLEVDTSAYRSWSAFLRLLVPHIRGQCEETHYLSSPTSVLFTHQRPSINASCVFTWKTQPQIVIFLWSSGVFSSPSLVLPLEMLMMSEFSQRESNQKVSAGERFLHWRAGWLFFIVF